MSTDELADKIEALAIIRGMRARIAELEADKVRLDWLNKNGREHGYGPQWRISWEFGQEDNIRAVIDAAMRNTQNPLSQATD